MIFIVPGFCVERHDLITTFKPEPYWVLQTTLEISSGESTRKLSLEWERMRCFDKEVAVMFMNQVKSQSQAKVISVSMKGEHLTTQDLIRERVVE